MIPFRMMHYAVSQTPSFSTNPPVSHLLAPKSMAALSASTYFRYIVSAAFLIVLSSHVHSQKSTTEHLFLASRILFLCTAAASSARPFIQWLVEHKQPNVPGSGTAIDIIGTKLDDLIEFMKEGNAIAKDATTDLLKLVFNLCVHYPKVCTASPFFVCANRFTDRRLRSSES